MPSETSTPGTSRLASLTRKARRKGRSAGRQAKEAMVARASGGGALAARVSALEADAAECRRLHQRVAELTDIMQELVLPLSQRDDARVREVLDAYADSL